MSSNITINEGNKETFSSAEKLCLSDKKIALEIFYEPADKFFNNKGKEQFRRKCKECNNFKVGDLAGRPLCISCPRLRPSGDSYSNNINMQRSK